MHPPSRAVERWVTHARGCQNVTFLCDGGEGRGGRTEKVYEDEKEERRSKRRRKVQLYNSGSEGMNEDRSC